MEKEIKVSAKVGSTKSVKEITASATEAKRSEETSGVTKCGIKFKKLKGIIFLL